MSLILFHPKNLWLWITSPPPGVQKPELQRRSRMLLSILVVLTFLALGDLVYQWVQLPFITDPSEERIIEVVFPLILGAALVCFFIAYLLGRTGHTTMSAMTLVALAIVGSWAMVLFTRESDTLPFSAMGVVLASVVLSRRQTLAIAMAIVGYSDVIASQPAESVGRYADLIKGAGLRAGRLTGQLLAFSRQQLLNPVATDLNQLVAGLEHILRSMLNERIRLAVHLDPAAAYGIAAQSEGRIEVTSGPGHGNAFVVLLPEKQGPS